MAHTLCLCPDHSRSRCVGVSWLPWLPSAAGGGQALNPAGSSGRYGACVWYVGVRVVEWPLGGALCALRHCAREPEFCVRVLGALRPARPAQQLTTDREQRAVPAEQG